MRRHGALSLVLPLLGLATTPAPAQVTPRVDVGVISLGYTGTARATALSVTPAVRLERPTSLAVASATFSQFGGGEWSAQAALGASMFTPGWRMLRGEFAASATAIAYRDVFRAGDGLLRARAHVHTLARGAWAGAGGGWSRHADRWHPLTLADVGLWAEHGAIRVNASVTSRFVTVADSFIDGEGVLARFERRGAHLDALLGVSWSSGPLQVDVEVGARDGGRLAPDAQWAGVSALLRVTPWLSVIAEGGGEPEVISQRLPGGRYGLLALRFSPRERAAATFGRAPPIAEFVLAGAAGGMRRVRIVEPTARYVELRADFTDWQPVPLARAADGSWQLALPLSPGVYRVSIRVDGGDWRAPTGVPAIVDEFGSVVGLIIVR